MQSWAGAGGGIQGVRRTWTTGMVRSSSRPRPVKCFQNLRPPDYVPLDDPEADQALRVFFCAAEGGPCRIPPARLPAHETAYAATVHKSQGSEAERILLILPNEVSPVMTRELIYTGLTRARSHVEVWGTPSVFEAAVSRRLTRSSGLRDALWQSQ
jgi:exodeoxyribonuclease V alpha subunit